MAIQNIRYNQNVTLHLEIERLSFPVQSGYDYFHYPKAECKNAQCTVTLPNQKKPFNDSFSPPARGDPRGGSYNLVGDSCDPFSPIRPSCIDERTRQRMKIDLSREFRFAREIRMSDMEISEANLQMMPGFRLRWNYTGIDLKLDPLLEYPVQNRRDWTVEFRDNKEFIREANKKQLYPNI